MPQTPPQLLTHFKSLEDPSGACLKHKGKGGQVKTVHATGPAATALFSGTRARTHR